MMNGKQTVSQAPKSAISSRPPSPCHKPPELLHPLLVVSWIRGQLPEANLVLHGGEKGLQLACLRPMSACQSYFFLFSAQLVVLVLCKIKSKNWYLVSLCCFVTWYGLSTLHDFYTHFCLNLHTGINYLLKIRDGLQILGSWVTDFTDSCILHDGHRHFVTIYEVCKCLIPSVLKI